MLDLKEVRARGDADFGRQERFPLPLCLAPRPAPAVPRAGDTHGGGHRATGGGDAPFLPTQDPPVLPGSSLPAALPPVSTDQPLPRGAPAAPLHQEISSQPQERQQQPRCHQGDQGLLRRVPVAPPALLFKGFYSKLEKQNKTKRKKKNTKKKKINQNTKESREWDKQETFASAAQASNNAAPHLLGKLHVNRARLCCSSSAPAPEALTGSFPAWTLLWHREFLSSGAHPGVWSTRLGSLCVLQLCLLYPESHLGSAPRANSSLGGVLGGGIINVSVVL